MRRLALPRTNQTDSPSVNDEPAAISDRSSPPARRLFAVGAINKKAIVYSASTGEEQATFLAKSGINAVAFAGVGAATRLLAGTITSQVHMWRVEGGVAEAECEISPLGAGVEVKCLAVGARGSTLAVGGAKGMVGVYALVLPSPPMPSFDDDDDGGAALDMAAGQINELYRLPAVGTAPVLSLSLDDEATLLVTGGESKIVSLWDLPVRPRLCTPVPLHPCSLDL